MRFTDFLKNIYLSLANCQEFQAIRIHFLIFHSSSSNVIAPASAVGDGEGVGVNVGRGDGVAVAPERSKA